MQGILVKVAVSAMLFFVRDVQSMPQTLPAAIAGESVNSFLRPLLTETYVNCSAICSIDLNCVGITIFQVKQITENDTIFWCRTDVNHSHEDKQKGKVVFSAILRDKMPKVVRVPIRPSTKSKLRIRSGRDFKDDEHVFNQNTGSDLQAAIDLKTISTKLLENPELAQTTVQQKISALFSSSPQLTKVVTVPVTNQSTGSPLPLQTNSVGAKNMSAASTEKPGENVPAAVPSNVTSALENSQLAQITIQHTVPAVFESFPQETSQVSIPNVPGNTTNANLGNTALASSEIKPNEVVSASAKLPTNGTSALENPDLAQITIEHTVPAVFESFPQEVKEVTVTNTAGNQSIVILGNTTKVPTQVSPLNPNGTSTRPEPSNATQALENPDLAQITIEHTVPALFESLPQLTNQTTAQNVITNQTQQPSAITTTPEPIFPDSLQANATIATPIELKSSTEPPEPEIIADISIRITTNNITTPANFTLSSHGQDTGSISLSQHKNEATLKFAMKVVRPIAGANVILDDGFGAKENVSQEGHPIIPPPLVNPTVLSTATSTPSAIVGSSTTPSAAPINFTTTGTVSPLPSAPNVSVQQTTGAPFTFQIPGTGKISETDMLATRIIPHEEGSGKTNILLVTQTNIPSETDMIGAKNVSSEPGLLPESTNIPETLEVPGATRSPSTTLSPVLSNQVIIDDSAGAATPKPATQIFITQIIQAPLPSSPSSAQTMQAPLPPPPSSAQTIQAPLPPTPSPAQIIQATLPPPPSPAQIIQATLPPAPSPAQIIQAPFAPPFSSAPHEKLPFVDVQIPTTTTGRTDELSFRIASARPVPPQSQLLEGEELGTLLGSTEIPITQDSFEDTQHTTSPSSGLQRPFRVVVTSSGKITIPEDAPFLTHNSGYKTDAECTSFDKERLRRDIIATAFSRLNDEPTMLTFANQSECVGVFSKTGRREVKSIRKLFPDFPFGQKQVVAGAFYNDSVFLFDDDEEQNVWRFFYDSTSRTYREEPQELMTTQVFLEEACGIQRLHFNVKAIAQLSYADNSCILFDSSANMLVSPNASDDARSFADVIVATMAAEFVNYVESVFTWLDEPEISYAYIFGSNDEVYEIFRNSTTDFKWKKGSYRIVPYEDFPYR